MGIPDSLRLQQPSKIKQGLISGLWGRSISRLKFRGALVLNQIVQQKLTEYLGGGVGEVGGGAGGWHVTSLWLSTLSRQKRAQVRICEKTKLPVPEAAPKRDPDRFVQRGARANETPLSREGLDLDFGLAKSISMSPA